MKLPQINDKKLLNQQTINTRKKIATQQGAALIIFMLVLMLSAVTYLVGGLDTKSVALDREKQTQAALAEAKAALIGDAIKLQNLGSTTNTQPITLSNPDLGSSSAIDEGSETGNAGARDYLVIGKLPWRSLGIPALKDGWNECLWYVVSGRFKNYMDTNPPLNWDTQGQIDVIDEQAKPVASNLAALVIAPGPVLFGQDRSSGQMVYAQCGGNYDAKNYLDTVNSNNAILGNVNYFSGTKNNSVAPNANNKTFVMANNVNYNDRFAFITVDDIFNRIMFRKDFSDQIANFATINVNHKDSNGALIVETVDPKTKLVQVSLKDVPLSGDKGTSSIACIKDNYFCQNWLEMVLLKEFTKPIKIKAGNAESLCNRVLIFGGRKTANQKRSQASDRLLPENYLESPNLDSFKSTPTVDPVFVGNSTFDPKHPEVDVITCLK